jgi:hypothetical protein
MVPSARRAIASGHVRPSLGRPAAR